MSEHPLPGRAFAERMSREGDLVRVIHPQTSEQVGTGPMALRRPARVGVLIDRHHPHQAHQPPDAPLVHRVAVVAQVPGHLPNSEDRGLQVRRTLIDLPHQSEVLLRLALGRAGERRTRDRQQLALPADRQVRVVRLDHAAPHVPPQGFSFRSKKELATVSPLSLGPMAFQWLDPRSWRGAPSSAPRQPPASCGPRVRTHPRRLRAGLASMDGSSSPYVTFAKRMHCRSEMHPEPACQLGGVVRAYAAPLARRSLQPSPFRASNATLALNSGACCFRFDISDLLLVEDQQTANRSLCQCPNCGG